jgi:hypothetical protein
MEILLEHSTVSRDHLTRKFKSGLARKARREASDHARVLGCTHLVTSSAPAFYEEPTQQESLNDGIFCTGKTYQKLNRRRQEQLRHPF